MHSPTPKKLLYFSILLSCTLTSILAQPGPIPAGGFGGRLGIVPAPTANQSQQVNVFPPRAQNPTNNYDFSTNVYWIPSKITVQVGGPVQPGALMIVRTWTFPNPNPFVFTGADLPSENPNTYSISPAGGNIGAAAFVSKSFQKAPRTSFSDCFLGATDIRTTGVVIRYETWTEIRQPTGFRPFGALFPANANATITGKAYRYNGAFINENSAGPVALAANWVVPGATAFWDIGVSQMVGGGTLTIDGTVSPNSVGGNWVQCSLTPADSWTVAVPQTSFPDEMTITR